MCVLLDNALIVIVTIPSARGAKSQGWTRGQLKYYTSLVLCSPKEARKMAQFFLDFQVISEKKKVFAAKWHNLLRIFRRCPKKKVFGLPFRSMGPMKPSGPSHGPPKPHDPSDRPP